MFNTDFETKLRNAVDIAKWEAVDMNESIAKLHARREEILRKRSGLEDILDSYLAAIKSTPKAED